MSSTRPVQSGNVPSSVDPPLDPLRKHHSGIMMLLIMVYAVGGWCLPAHLRGPLLFDHYPYIPLVIAGIWWGRKAVALAFLFAASAYCMDLFSEGVEPRWAIASRLIPYLFVTWFVGALSFKARSRRKALEASEEEYELLVAKSLTGILIYRDDRIVFASPRFAQMLGCPSEAMVGRSIWDFVHELDRPQIRSIISRRQDGDYGDYRYECRFIRSDGGVIWADVASSGARYQGHQAIMVSAYDITDRKESEEKRRELSELTRRQTEQLVHSTRLAELGEMAAAVAHELNQPLTGIKNYAKNAVYMIENSAGTPQDILSNVRQISEQVDRAARIISQMRQLTRRTERHFAPVDINGIVRDSVEFVMPQFRLSGVEVSVSLGDGLPKVMGDRMWLEQVFLNLLTNARHAMEPVIDRKLHVRTWLDHRRDCPVVAEVTDSGVGFNQEDTDRLFMPFFSTKEVGRGTGLGLSISLNIIQEHRGQIEALGRPGKGATFRVRLPIAGQPGAPSTGTPPL